MVRDRYVKNAGAMFSLKYHVVWCPKYRRPVLCLLRKSGKLGFVGVTGEVKVRWHRQLPSEPNSAITVVHRELARVAFKRRRRVASKGGHRTLLRGTLWVGSLARLE